MKAKREIKKILIEKYNRCSVCGIGPRWNGKPLVLQLDHKNGKHDHTEENCRLLCPNCHSQTENYAGRGCKKPRFESKCMTCGTTITDKKHRKYCSRQCAGKGTNHYTTQPKIDWPAPEVVVRLVVENGYRGTGKKLGVSDVAVRKHLEKRSLLV